MEFNPISFFWHSEDLLWCLSDHVVVNYGVADLFADRPRRQFVDKYNLSVLCRVNRMCRLVFTPVLYRHITITDQFGHGDARFTSLPLMRLLAESLFVTHTQTLTIGYCEGPEDLHHEVACRLAHCLSSLRRFHCFGMPLEASTAAALVSSCGHLSAVCIEFPAYDIDDIGVDDDGGSAESGNQSYRVDLEGVVMHLGNLTRLKELCLDHLYGHPEQWIAPIAQVLIASPGLQSLQLSMSENAVTFHLDRREPDLTPFKTFLLRIATLYKASGASPLRLCSFRCGSGVHPNFPPGSPVAITDLICLDDLETVYLNTSIGVPAIFGPTFHIAGADRHIPISTLLHDTPRLRRFSVSRYDALVQDALTLPILNLDRTRRLAVMWDVLPEPMVLGPGSLVGISSFPRYHFRMLKIEFRRFAPDDKAVLMEARGILKGLVDGDDGTLEGLDVVLPVDGRESYVELLAGMIPGLAGLTQMNLRHGKDEVRIFCHFQFWMKAAERLTMAGERLRYIGTGTWFMKVVRGEEGTVPGMRTMGVQEEVDDVELFGLTRKSPDYVFPDRGDL
ncbi:hypothetical protein B0T18DRAFT_395557 [Schizothecium vesticola]|uniref:Uncharacterized protein n=1 Tax=Schizothecium vesticola TaxID=314040 RepID=A0AA40KBA9_9PEZI|nr:hypothetical protein B0T18DRAFT_395557 [Schizothecium vesticola]